MDEQCEWMQKEQQVQKRAVGPLRGKKGERAEL